MRPKKIKSWLKKMSRRKSYSGRERPKPQRSKALGYSRKSKTSVAETPWAKRKRKMSFLT